MIIFFKNFPLNERKMNIIEEFKSLILKGIAYYHDGMLPQLKYLAEILLEQSLIKVIFCTENIFNDMNNQAKTVVLTSLVKFDGKTERYLMTREFNKICRKAGREDDQF